MTQSGLPNPERLAHEPGGPVHRSSTATSTSGTPNPNRRRAITLTTPKTLTYITVMSGVEKEPRYHRKR